MLNTNALAIPSSSEGGRILGHLALVIPEDQYTNVSEDVAFIPPARPEANPTHEAGATGAQQITETNRLFRLAQNQFNLLINTSQALQNLILSNVPHQYIDPLRHHITQFNTVTPLELMTHLWAQYHAGKFSAKDLTSNWARMNAQWTPPTAIENLFKQLLD